MRTWDYHNPTRLVVGPGALRRLAAHAPGRVLLVTSAGSTDRGLTEQVVENLGQARVLVHDRVEPNPSVDQVDSSIASLRGEHFDTIVAIGGGSAIDTGKVLSLALATPDASVRGLLAGGAEAGVPPIPVVAVPTTAGTGSEVTPFATVWDTSTLRKHSVARPTLFPRVAIVDPTLAVGLSWETTLSSGLDAYVQCYEALYNRNANALTSGLAARGAILAPDALRTLNEDPNSADARGRMAEAALLSGLAIAHTRTALAHSMSYPITAHLGVPHGLACALVFPAVLEFNLDHAADVLEGLAQGFGVAGSEALLEGVIDLYRDLDVGRVIGRYLDRVEAVNDLVAEMVTPERSDNNVRPVDEAAIRSIIDRTVDLVGAGLVA